MKIIEGYENALAALSRGAAAEAVTVSPALRQSLQKLFGTADPEAAVRLIIGKVREGGDAAIRELAAQIDGITIDSLEVSKQEIAAARKKVDGSLLAALELAAGRIRGFHEAQRQAVWHEVNEAGLRQLLRPLQRAGVYVPGGTAVYPSTVLMTAIPAKVAGVGEVVMVTPPGKDGKIPSVTLAAAHIAGVDRVFRVGGAQAIAALAYGTASVPAVDKICGPGNIFVMLAKKQVFGAVAIDGLQGPSEVVIIADDSSDAAYVAADLLAQAEHDALASAVLITTSKRLAGAVEGEVARQLAGLSRRSIAGEVLKRGIIAVVASLEEAIDLSNRYAPEHLCLMVAGAEDWLDRITSAGCVLAGREATVVLGDYVAGPSHALPTGGTARFASPLSVSDFIKIINVVNTEALDLQKLGKAAAIMARAEGLDAHAMAIGMRLKDNGGGS